CSRRCEAPWGSTAASSACPRTENPRPAPPRDAGDSPSRSWSAVGHFDCLFPHRNKTQSETRNACTPCTGACFRLFLFWGQVRRRKDGKRKSNDHGWFSVSGCAAGAGRRPCAHHPPKQHTAAQIRALVRTAVHLCRSTEHGGCLRQFRGDRGDRRGGAGRTAAGDRKSTRLSSSHVSNSYAVYCLKKKKE